MIKINFLHRYNYEFFWGMCHGAEIEPKDVQVMNADSTLTKYCDLNTDGDYSAVTHNFGYGNHDFEVSFNPSPKNGYINIFNLNYHYFETNKLEEAVIPVSFLYNDFVDNLIPKLNKYKREGFHISFMFNSWEPITGYEKEHPFLLYLDNSIPVFTDSLVDNNELTEKFGIVRKNRFNSYTQFVNSLFWPSTLYFREFYHHHNIFKEQDRNKQWKFHYMTRRWYSDKAEVANALINIGSDDIGITMSDSFNRFDGLSNASNTILSDEHEVYNNIKKYLSENKNKYDKRGYNLDDFGGEWISDNSRELLYKILPLSNITILHEHQYHTSEKIIAHLILGKPFLPVYYKTLDNIQMMFDQFGLEIPQPPFDRYETIHDIMDKIKSWSEGENWIEFRDSMYDWTYKFRETLRLYMNQKNSLFDAIIKNKNHFNL